MYVVFFYFSLQTNNVTLCLCLLFDFSLNFSFLLTRPPPSGGLFGSSPAHSPGFDARHRVQGRSPAILDNEARPRPGRRADAGGGGTSKSKEPVGRPASQIRRTVLPLFRTPRDAQASVRPRLPCDVRRAVAAHGLCRPFLKLPSSALAEASAPAPALPPVCRRP